MSNGNGISFLDRPWTECEACQDRTRKHRNNRGSSRKQVKPCPEHNPDRQDVKRFDVTEVAKLVRKALRERYPERDTYFFSVKSDRYAGGSAVRVSWTGGPDQREVERYLEPLAGRDFDGMTDLETFRPPVWINGEPVTLGAGYITCNRKMTEAEREAAAGDDRPVMAY